MYQLLLILHNLTRWIVLALGVWALYRAYSGLASGRAWTRADRQAGALFAAFLGIQFILGVLFYIVPGTSVNAMLGNLGAAMRDPQLRFFIAEHSVVMFVAVLLSNIGAGAARRAATDRSKFRRAAVFYTLTFLLVILAIPWPFLSYGRPLIRL
jgi:hypothetical protein